MNKREGKENIFSSLNLQEVTSTRGGKTSNNENSSNKNGQRSQKHHEGQGQLKPSFTSVCIFPVCMCVCVLCHAWCPVVLCYRKDLLSEFCILRRWFLLIYFCFFPSFGQKVSNHLVLELQVVVSCSVC